MSITYSTFDNQLFSKIESFATATASDANIIQSVRSILEQVKDSGDTAVLEKTLLYDKATLQASELLVDTDDLNQGFDSLTVDEKKALDVAEKNISDFHEQSLPKPWTPAPILMELHTEKDTILYNESVYMFLEEMYLWCLRF